VSGLKKELKELERVYHMMAAGGSCSRSSLRPSSGAFSKSSPKVSLLWEREAFYQGNGAVGNGYYSRGLDGLFGRIEALRVPRTRGGGFRRSKVIEVFPGLDTCAKVLCLAREMSEKCQQRTLRDFSLAKEELLASGGRNTAKPMSAPRRYAL